MNSWVDFLLDFVRSSYRLKQETCNCARVVNLMEECDWENLMDHGGHPFDYAHRFVNLTNWEGV